MRTERSSLLKTGESLARRLNRIWLRVPVCPELAGGGRPTSMRRMRSGRNALGRLASGIWPPHASASPPVCQSDAEQAVV
jgi:hypothetical protein